MQARRWTSAHGPWHIGVGPSRGRDGVQRFLAIGECMVEMAPADDGRYIMGFAGDTFNTAWYMRRLAGPGTEVAYLSAIGDDAISARMEDFMRTAGIVPELSVRPGRTVGLYLISLENGERSFSYWRNSSAARSLAEDLGPLPGVGEADIAFFSGITMAILPDAGRRRLLDRLAEARERGVRVVFDPNLRPRLWSDGEEMRHWITQAARVGDIVLPSFDDEAGHFGDADPAATAARYADLGAGLVVVKNGDGPALVREGEETVEIAPHRVDTVVDTTAAGDSFNAGFLNALAGGEDAPAAARAGCALSARVIRNRGALVDPATPGA